MNESYGLDATVVGTVDVTRLVGYYAPAKIVTLPKNTTTTELLRVVRRRQPAVVLIHRGRLPESVYESLLQRRQELGFEEIDVARVAPGYENLIVLARPVTEVAPPPNPPLRRRNSCHMARLTSIIRLCFSSL